MKTLLDHCCIPFNFWLLRKSCSWETPRRSPCQTVCISLSTVYPSGLITMRRWTPRCDWLLAFHSRRRRDANVKARTRQRGRGLSSFRRLFGPVMHPRTHHAQPHARSTHARVSPADLFRSIEIYTGINRQRIGRVLFRGCNNSAICRAEYGFSLFFFSDLR